MNADSLPADTLLHVRYTSGHRCGLSSGWHPYGDKRPLPRDMALLLAMTLRQQGAEVKLEAVAAPETPQLGLFGVAA